MRILDLNADLGEGMGNEEALLDIVSSASIACGGHAGDSVTMQASLRAARVRGVRVGAHPGFADKEHFGRKRLILQAEDLDAMIRAQVQTLVEMAEQEGVAVAYVKLHGALANMAAEEPAVAALAFAACEGLARDLAVLAIDHSAQVEAAQILGFRVIREAYADRAYLPNGLLVPRGEDDAVIHDAGLIAARAVRLAEVGEIIAIDGSVLRTGARSLCVHGDTPEAVGIARTVRLALERSGINVAATL